MIRVDSASGSDPLNRVVHGLGEEGKAVQELGEAGAVSEAVDAISILSTLLLLYCIIYSVKYSVIQE